MKQGKIIAAYKRLLLMNKVPGLPFGLCSKLFHLKKKMEPYYQAQVEQENVALEASGQKPENGQWDITPEIRRVFMQISETEVDWNEEKINVELTEDIAEKLMITGETLEILEDFINFTGV